ncbi:hypothetical protein ACWDV4_16540 [Micromonospora sp. NPDC003197]
MARLDPTLAALTELAARIREKVRPGDILNVPETHYLNGTEPLRLLVTRVGGVVQVGSLLMVEIVGYPVDSIGPTWQERWVSVRVVALDLPGAVTRPAPPS